MVQRAGSTSSGILGRLTKIERDSAPEVRVDFAYNAAGEFTSIKRYKDLDGGASNLVVDSTYTYDGIGRLTSLTHFEDTTTFADYDWTYDAFSRVTSFAFSHLVGGSGSSAYTYDNTSQVTAADHSNQTDETYTYDSAGNRTISGYTTGDPNRLTSDGTFDFTYDDEGNRLTMTRTSSAQADDKTTEYTWDYRNRLTKVVEKNNSGAITQQIEYVYDIWDRRIEKSFDADGAGSGSAVVTRWAYDPQPVYDGNGIALYNILLTVDASGLVTNRYVHGPAPDQILADDQVGAVLVFALADNLGTVRDVIDDAGSVENHLVYDAFGRVTSETTSSFDFHYGYTGRERDEETGLQYNRARYYDAVHGRFLNDDPWVFDGGDYNLGRYGGNDAINNTDPSGLRDPDEDLPQVREAMERERIEKRRAAAQGRSTSTNSARVHVPSSARGKWVSGTRGDGVFEYADTPQNRADGVAGKRIRFKSNYIALGGFPPEAYYGGSAEAASVPIKVVLGTDADFTAADAAMRIKLNDPNWVRPKGYTWNHAGCPGSTTMELVDRPLHGAVHHSGSASAPRAANRMAGRATNGVFAGIAVFMVFSEAARWSGVLPEQFVVVEEADYYFVDDDGSIFVVAVPGGLRSWVTDPTVRFIAGPRAGEEEVITEADVAAYYAEAEAVWGRYIPATWGSEARFIPGTKRKRFEFQDPEGLFNIGYLDEDGPHYYKCAEPIVQ